MTSCSVASGPTAPTSCGWANCPTPTWVGFCVAFIVDVCSRRIVGWASATHLRTELPLAALDMAAALRDERLGAWGTATTP